MRVEKAVPTAPFREIDRHALERRLRQVDAEVRFDDGSRALYATDSSNYRYVPVGLVVPRSIQAVVDTVAVCREYGVPLTSRGGGTSLAGQTCNTAVIMDFSKHLDRVLAIDAARHRARVLPGCRLDRLRGQAVQHALNFGPDPATHQYNTLGGMIGNNSCGVHSIAGGQTVDNVHELDVLTYRGQRLRVGRYDEDDLARIIAAGGPQGAIFAQLRSLRDRYANELRTRYPKIPRNSAGYALNQLLPENGFHVARSLVGSEGTCVTILEADVRLIANPPFRSMLVLGYPDIFSAGDHVPQIVATGPFGLEAVDHILIENMKLMGVHAGYAKLLPKGGGWLIIEYGGETQAEADDKSRQAMAMLRQVPNPPPMVHYSERAPQEAIWEIRKSGLGVTAEVPGQPMTWPGWEDSSVAPEQLGGYLRALQRLFDKYGYSASLYGHFGQGCVHCSIDFDLFTAAGVAQYRRFVEEATDLVVGYGGTISGEHGDGQARGELQSKMYGPALTQAFAEFKAIWDPDWLMNPGKVTRANRLDEGLRLGPTYAPPDVATHFQFPDDEGSFAKAALRCAGVGLCRKLDTGTMCPSYMVTGEEKHSTRGRARLLFEMLRGETIKDGWRSEAVKDALDLCLSCKGCKGECPVSVDMATYKAEFLSHYFEHHRRPRQAFSMGLIMYWARLAAWMPRLVNLVTQAPGLGRLAKLAAGIAPQRQIPRFAPQTFKAWFARRPVVNPTGPAVILWPDTFNNHFTPEAAKAAVEVLEHFGFRVQVPRAALCCGRPLHDFGFLDHAKTLLEQILAELRPWIRQGVPMIGLEPSCTTVFRDEMINLLPHDEDARRLCSQTLTFAEFLVRHVGQERLPKLAEKAVVHSHCHHKSVLGTDCDKTVLDAVGLDHQVLDSGCCGMAGTFGFEPDKYELSLAIGERVLLPAVRAAAPETLLVTDGFSCHEQIGQCTGRPTLHLAEVLAKALRGEAATPLPVVARNGGRRLPVAALAVGGLAIAGFAAWRRWQAGRAT